MKFSNVDRSYNLMLRCSAGAIIGHSSVPLLPPHRFLALPPPHQSRFRSTASPRGEALLCRNPRARRGGLHTIKKDTRLRVFWLEAPPGFEPGNRGFAVHCLTTWLWRHYGAGDEARTRYLHLGKVALYRMSYARIFNSFPEDAFASSEMVPPVGVEPTTRGFSIRCSTN